MSNEFSPETIEKEIQEPELLFVRPEILTDQTIPEPLHGVNPRSFNSAKWWNTERRTAYAYNNYHCFTCGTYAPYDKTKKKFSSDLKLHAHERYTYYYTECKAVLTEVVAICPICHDGIHIQRLQAKYDNEEVDEEYMWVVYEQRKRVLNLDDNCWNKWHLDLEGDYYYSKFKNRKEWEEHYGQS